MTERQYEHNENIHSLLKRLVSEGKAKRIERFDLYQGILYSIGDPAVAVVERWFSQRENPGFTSGMSPFLYVIGREEDVLHFQRTYGLTGAKK